MKLTNNYNLPDALFRAVANDSYNPGTSDYTATGLLRPARIVALSKAHSDELEEDASDRLWSLLGQAVHTILERAGGNELKEERLYADFNGVSVSAQIDNLCMESGALCDYKITTGWKFKGNKPPDPDYVSQLNIQAEILRRNGYTINSLFIVGILRDWSKLEAQRNPDYPQSQVIKQPIPLWTSEQTTAFINLRIADHERAKSKLPECSPSEMWQKDGQWAVSKAGQKRALKLFSTEESALAFWETNEQAYTIAYRPGSRTRCENYCPVNKFCSQYKSYLENDL